MFVLIKSIYHTKFRLSVIELFIELYLEINKMIIYRFLSFYFYLYYYIIKANFFIFLLQKTTAKGR